MTQKTETFELNERSLSLLKSLVQSYIRDGQPIGSKALAERSELELSPATIRNVMSGLEDAGFLTSAHTSAGRIPTKRGYRLFVDTLIKVAPLPDDEISRLQKRLGAGSDANSNALVQTASSLLSSLTHLAGVVTVPRKAQRALSHVEFVPLGERRVLAILVVGENDVQNRILSFDRDFSPAQLRQASNYLNAQFAGRTIDEVRSSILSELSATRSSMDELMASAIHMASKLFAEPFAPGESCVIAGETNLMDAAELSDLEKLRRLFDAFNEKREVLHLLDKCLSSDGVQIFIGEDSGWSADVSVVGAPYTVGDEVVGVLGVIGPTRMAYERVIPIVDATARILGAALNSRT